MLLVKINNKQKGDKMKKQTIKTKDYYKELHLKFRRQYSKLQERPNYFKTLKKFACNYILSLDRTTEKGNQLYLACDRLIRLYVDQIN